MIAYASRTGNVKHIIKCLDLPASEITTGMNMQTPFLLMTYTDALGEAPKPVLDFLKDNHSLCIGVVASGNSNFGNHLFCGSADQIHELYRHIPIIHKIELRGFPDDYEIIKDFYYEVMEGRYEELS